MTDSATREHLCAFKGETSFSFLSEEDFAKIACYFETATFPARTVIFREGDPAEFVGFVLSGRLEVKKQTEFKGNQLIIAILTRGAVVGELSLFDGHTRSATVETVEDSVLLVLRKDACEALLRDQPAIGIKLLKGFIRTLAVRLRKATERLTAVF